MFTVISTTYVSDRRIVFPDRVTNLRLRPWGTTYVSEDHNTSRIVQLHM